MPDVSFSSAQVLKLKRPQINTKDPHFENSSAQYSHGGGESRHDYFQFWHMYQQTIRVNERHSVWHARGNPGGFLVFPWQCHHQYGTSEAIANLQGVSSTPYNRFALTNFGLRKTDIVWRELSCTDLFTKIGADKFWGIFLLKHLSLGKIWGWEPFLGQLQC